MSFSPTYLGNFQISRTKSNTPSLKNKKFENQHHFIQSAYNRVFLSLKSQHTILIAFYEMVQQLISEEPEKNKNERNKETLSKLKKVLNVILNSFYGNLFQINFAAVDSIEEILNPTTHDQSISAEPLSTSVESLGYKILSACLTIKRLVSILSFTNYINTQLRFSQTEKNKETNNFNNNNNNNPYENNDPELIEAEDDYQFDTFDSGSRVSSLGEKRGISLFGYQHHKKSHHSKEKNSNHSNNKNKNKSNSNTQNNEKTNNNQESATSQITTENLSITPTPNDAKKVDNDTSSQQTSSISTQSPKITNDQISTEKDESVYSNCFHIVDDSGIPDSNSDFEEDYSDSYYYDDYYSDDEYDKPPTVICRICEKEVPLSMIEEHSKSCVKAYESSRTMKSADDRMRKLQAFAQQTVLHVEWPCNEEYAKTVVIPILHVVALLDRAISIDLNSSGASEELDLICSCLNEISIAKPRQSTPINNSKPNQIIKSPTVRSNSNSSIKLKKDDYKKQPPLSTSVVHFNFRSSSNGKRNRSATVSMKSTSASSTSTPTDRTKILLAISPEITMSDTDYQDAMTVLSRARALVNEKSTAAISLSHAIDVYKQTTYIGMRGDLNDVSVYIRKEVTIADFSFIRRISSGAYAKVYLTRKTQTGDLSATKVIHRDSLRQKNDLQRVMVEKNILSLVSNPFMIRFFFSIIGKNNLYLVMEYCPGGDLFSVLQNIGTLPEDKALIYTAEVVEALEFLRKKNVIHRDLKPDNILVAANGHLKLTDFGMSAFGIFDRSVTNNETMSSESNSTFSTPTTSNNNNNNNNNANTSLSPVTATRKSSDSGQESNVERRESHDSSSSNVSFPGTPDYIAPEIILQQSHTFTADYWSLGCIIYELLTGIPPFHGETPEITFANILKGVYDESPLLSDDITEEAVDLIRRLLARDPKKRLGSESIDEIKQHPWFTNANIDWNNLLDLEPPFIPQLDNEEDTSYFEERYAMSNDDEKDIREDIEEAKLSMMNKSEKKSQSFFSDEKKNLFTESSPTSMNDNQGMELKSSSTESIKSIHSNTNESNIQLSSQSSYESNIENESEKVQNDNKTRNNNNNKNTESKIPPLSNYKDPSNQPKKSRTTSSMGSNSFASSNNNNMNSDDDLSLFPSCSSGSLQTLTIEDSMKKFQKLQRESSLPSKDEYGTKIRVSRSSHNLRKMILNELNKDGSNEVQSQKTSPSLKHTHSQIIQDKQKDLLESGNSNINVHPNTNRNTSHSNSKQRRLHVNHFNSSTNLPLYNDSENAYDDYSDEVNQSPHFVESKSVSSLHKKLYMTPDGTKRRRHSHRRTHRSPSSRNCSDDGSYIYSSSSSNLLSHLQQDDENNQKIGSRSNNTNINVGDVMDDSALISGHFAQKNKVASPGEKEVNENHDYPLSRFVKSDGNDDDDEEEEEDI